MAKDTTKDIAKKEADKISKKAEINEAYFVGLLWSDPYANYGEYSDTISQDEFIHDVWGFYFELGRIMYSDGIKNFDEITVQTKVKDLGIADSFKEYGSLNTIYDAVSIVKDNIDNIDYYYETIKKNYVIRQLYLLFGEKVLLSKGKYKWDEMSREQLTMYWSDKINKISLDNVNRYEAENLYIDADLFIKKLKEASADMLPYYNSYLMNSISQGVPRGHVTMIGGFGGTGKCLHIDTPIPTPNGWTTMGKLEVGDLVFGQDGKPTSIINKSPLYTDHDTYKLTFDDGEEIIADAEHQWSVSIDYTKKLAKRGVTTFKGKPINSKGYFTITTEEMKDDFVRIREDGWKDYKYQIPMNEPIEYNEKELLIDPYIMGVWLGDGSKTGNVLTMNGDDSIEISKHFLELGYKTKITKEKDKHDCYSVRVYSPDNHIPFTTKLREAKVYNNKHIPREYLESSIEQRWELLKGLMDTDGSSDSKGGACEFSQKSKEMVDGFSELLSSLGIKHVVNKRITTCTGKEFESYRVYFNVGKDMSCFKLKRKHDKLKEKTIVQRLHKKIVNIEKVESAPMQCIMVDNDDHLYLAGKMMTVTHNSSITAEKFVMSCVENKEKAIILLNEEDAQAFRQKIVLTILWHEFKTGIDRRRMVNGKLQEQDEGKIRKAFAKMKELIDGEESLIKIIFMEKYVMKDLEKIVRFWANRGYINLLIDTHKVSDDSQFEARWQTFVEDMKSIYRWTRKNAGGMNLRTVVTFQLADSAIKNRYLDFEAIGEGKASKNEASVMYMFRSVWADEYDGEKKQLDCYKLKKRENGEGFDKEFFTLEKGKTYYLWFTPKNRFGQANDNGQPVLVIEPIFNANHFREIGWTFVANDKSGR